jgi:quercetin dioxygenase-like cupin family protein
MNIVRQVFHTVLSFLFPPRIEPCRVKGYRLYTGDDQHSYVETIEVPCLQRFPVAEIYFRQTPPGCVFARHTAPQKNYVLTLCGTLEFTTSLGETFVVKPGDVLLAEDVTGHGHSWKMLGNDPWVRAYVTLV